MLLLHLCILFITVGQYKVLFLMVGQHRVTGCVHRSGDVAVAFVRLQNAKLQNKIIFTAGVTNLVETEILHGS